MKSKIHNFLYGKNNNSCKKKIYTLTALLSFMAAISWGQVTRTINYQANITHNGVPLTRSSNTVQVMIHLQGAPGNIKYEEFHYNIPIINGLLNVTIGAGVVTPCLGCFMNLGELDWQNNYQVRLTINPSGNPNIQVPSALLHPSLVAIQAISTMQLSNSGNDMTTTNTGNFGIGQPVPTQRLDVAGAIRIADVTSAPNDGTIRYNGTDFEGRTGGNWVSLTAQGGGGGGGQWTTNGANIINNNTGNVGIGAANPVAKLEVSGPIRVGSFAGGNYPQTAGMMRFQSGIFEGYNGQAWVPFGAGGSSPTLSVNGNQLSISGGNTVTLPSLTPWTTVGNDIYNNNSGKLMIGIVNSTRPEKFQFIDDVTAAYQNSAKFIRSNPYGTVLAVIDSGLSGDPNYNKGLSAHSIYGTALYGESTRAYGLKVRGGGNTYPASLIEANSGAAGLVISNSSTTSAPQLNIEETTSGNYARLKLTNFSNPNNSWTIAGLNTTTPANDRLNLFHSTAGDVLSVTGDSKVGIGTANSGGYLEVKATSTTASPQLKLTENAGGGFTRLTFGNAVNTNTSYTISALNTGTAANDRLNLFHSTAGDVFSITGDGKTLIKGATAFNNSFGTTGQVLQSNGDNAAPTWVNPTSALPPPILYTNYMSGGQISILIGQYTTIPGLVRTFTTTSNVIATIKAAVPFFRYFGGTIGGGVKVISSIVVDGNIVAAEGSENYDNHSGHMITVSKLIQLAPGTHTIEIRFNNYSTSTDDVHINPGGINFFGNVPVSMDIMLINQ